MSDPWGAYARDQLALLDHLGIDRFHVMGCCIGGSFALKLIQEAPARVTAAVLEQPVGMADGNKALYDELWRAWGTRLLTRTDITPEAVEQFGTRMWRDEFVASVSREFVRTCETPLLVLPGTDRYHPAATGREIAALAPNGHVIEPWKDSTENTQQAEDTIRTFLSRYTPRS